MTLWEVDIYPADRQPDLIGSRVAAEARELGLVPELVIQGAHGYLDASALDSFLIKAVHSVDGGQAWVPRAMVGKIVDRLSHISTKQRLKGNSIQKRSSHP